MNCNVKTLIYWKRCTNDIRTEIREQSQFIKFNACFVMSSFSDAKIMLL